MKALKIIASVLLGLAKGVLAVIVAILGLLLSAPAVPEGTQVCGNCQGSGSCPSCSGGYMGKHLCIECTGSDACTYCNGRGYTG